MTPGLAPTQPGTTTPQRKMSTNQSLNHLLNFTLPPRETHLPPRRSNRKASGRVTWNKERFVNAQYRFVMKPSGDYTVHFADPDIFFQWQDILQVIIPRSSAFASMGGSQKEEESLTTCPICLSPPTAPRMTKCGHVFCLPCILHYLSTSDVRKWIRCPICFDSITESQLKSVKWFQGEQFDPGPSAGFGNTDSGKTLTMRLMERPQITTMALPRSHTWPSDLIPPHQAPFHFLPDVATYAKFMLATASYLIAELSADLESLLTERQLLVDMRDELGVVFADAALAKVREQIEKAEALDTEYHRASVDKARKLWQDLDARDARIKKDRLKFIDEKEQSIPEDEVPEAYLSLTAPSTAIAPRPHPDTRQQKQRKNVNPPPPSTSAYYFYQAENGSPVFLHPLDIRILLSHFTSYSSFPDTITLRVDAYAEGSVNDDVRKRCKHLSHMPEGADVVFLEADLEPIVGEDGLKNFQTALRTRRAKRKEKSRKEDRAKVRAEEREKEKAYGDAVRWAETPAARIVNSAQSNSVGAEAEVDPSVEPSSVVEPHAAHAAAPGMWGNRSFASALHSTTSARPRGHDNHHIDDEWDVDAAWHEAQQRDTGRGGGRGRKKGKAQKLVILGGGVGAAQRR